MLSGDDTPAASHRTFEYRRRVSAIGVATIVGFFLIASGILSRWTLEGPWTMRPRTGVVALGIWTIFQAIRRYHNPVRFIVEENTLRADYIRGEEKTWAFPRSAPAL